MQFAGNVSSQYQVVCSLSKYGFQVESAVVIGPMAPERAGPTLSRGFQIAVEGLQAAPFVAQSARNQLQGVWHSDFRVLLIITSVYTVDRRYNQ